MNKPKQNYKSEIDEVNQKDFFQTPNYATRLLLPFIPPFLKSKAIWECASGKGKIADVLKDGGYQVIQSDIHKYTDETKVFNFISDTNNIFDFSAIISNPPFSHKREFAYKALSYYKPFALLIPLDFNKWICDLVKNHGIQFVVPQTRISYITPTNRQGKDSAAQFHSAWMCYRFNLPNQLTIVDLGNKEDI